MKFNILSVVFIVSAISVVVAPGTYDPKEQPLLSDGELPSDTFDISREQSSSWLSKIVASRQTDKIVAETQQRANTILNQARMQADKIIVEAKEQANQAVQTASKAQQKITEQANEMLAHVQQQSTEANQLTDQMISGAERVKNYIRANVESARIGGAAPLCLEWQMKEVHSLDQVEISRLVKNGYEPFQVERGWTYYKRCEKWYEIGLP
ncbi:hypothetical protein MIR68_005198 [Amoeboaphelidium protococcarum]|nr:hypothetical protein MIR68_005198 [Amoeboaphelidium protococcarum]